MAFTHSPRTHGFNPIYPDGPVGHSPQTHGSNSRTTNMRIIYIAASRMSRRFSRSIEKFVADRMSISGFTISGNGDGGNHCRKIPTAFGASMGLSRRLPGRTGNGRMTVPGRRQGATLPTKKVSRKFSQQRQTGRRVFSTIY